MKNAEANIPNPEKIKLKCYSAFGGINGAIGAKNKFVIPLSPKCEEIYLYTFGKYKLVLQKDLETLEWQMIR